MKTTSENVKHTALPWRTDGPLILAGSGIDTERVAEVAFSETGKFRETSEANARFICAAVNSHYELVEALKEIQQMASESKACIRMPSGMMLDNYVRRVLAKAEGQGV